MLSAREIDAIADALGDQYEALQDSLMQTLISQINKGLSSEWPLKKLLQIGALEKDISTQILKQTQLSMPEIKELYKQAGLTSIKHDMQHLGGSRGKLGRNLTDGQLRVLMAGIRKTQNLVQNMAMVAEDSTLGLYKDLVTKGYTMLATGSYTVSQAVDSVALELVNKGVNGVVYASGVHNTIEAAVRRAMRTGVNQTIIELGFENAKEVGTDLVKVSQHAGARPAHALWQGRIFSISGKTAGYDEFRAATGYGSLLGLGGVNCRHNFFPYVEGMQVDEPMPEKMVNYNGEEITLYDAEQKMRSYEREYRQALREEQFAGKDTTARRVGLRKKMRDLERQTGAKFDYSRQKIYGDGTVPKIKKELLPPKPAKPALKPVEPPKPVKPAKPAKPAEILRRNYDNDIGKKLGKDAYDSMQEHVENCSNETLAKLWKEHEDGLRITLVNNDDAYCSYNSQRITFSKKGVLEGDDYGDGTLYHEPMQLLFHEGSHGLDNMLGHKYVNDKYYSLGYSNAYKDGLFPKTITDEVQEIVKRYEKENKDGIMSHLDDGEWLYQHGIISSFSKYNISADHPLKRTVCNKGMAYKRLEIELRAMKGEELGDLSDIIEGATRCKVRGGTGHGESYWSSHIKNAKLVLGREKVENAGLAKEAFAEMCDATLAAPKQLEKIKEYLPKSYALFEQMIKEIGENI